MPTTKRDGVEESTINNLYEVIFIRLRFLHDIEYRILWNIAIIG